MKLIVEYELTGAKRIDRKLIKTLEGPLKTGLYATNQQLDAEGERVRLVLEEIKGE